MKKNIFLVKEYQTTAGRFAIAEKVPAAVNLANLKYDAGLIACNMCATFKEAEKIADHWNECYKQKNIYAF